MKFESEYKRFPNRWIILKILYARWQPLCLNLVWLIAVKFTTEQWYIYPVSSSIKNNQRKTTQSNQGLLAFNFII